MTYGYFADNSRPDVGVLQRLDSPIIGLKNFNNWVKSVLISSHAHPALSKSRQTRGHNRKGKVLDLGCGKGGDLTKWTKAKIVEYVGAGTFNSLTLKAAYNILFFRKILLQSLLNKLGRAGKEYVPHVLMPLLLPWIAIPNPFQKHFHPKHSPSRLT